MNDPFQIAGLPGVTGIQVEDSHTHAIEFHPPSFLTDNVAINYWKRIYSYLNRDNIGPQGLLEGIIPLDTEIAMLARYVMTYGAAIITVGGDNHLTVMLLQGDEVPPRDMLKPPRLPAAGVQTWRKFYAVHGSRQFKLEEDDPTLAAAEGLAALGGASLKQEGRKHRLVTLKTDEDTRKQGPSTGTIARNRQQFAHEKP